MKPGPGSTVVPPEARPFFEHRYGHRYLIVEEGIHGVGVNRAARRRMKKKQR